MEFVITFEANSCLAAVTNLKTLFLEFISFMETVFSIFRN